MEVFDTEPRRLNGGSEAYNERIKVWFERAAVAYQRDSIALSKDALYRWWQYRQELARLEGKQIPEQPKEPQYYFGKKDGLTRNSYGNDGPGFGPPGGDPDQPAPVPRRPRPDAGASEVEIPLPSSVVK